MNEMITRLEALLAMICVVSICMVSCVEADSGVPNNMSTTNNTSSPTTTRTTAPPATLPPVTVVMPDMPATATDMGSDLDQPQCGVCCPGETRCAGNVAEVCMADGSGYMQTDCEAENKACEQGACIEPMVCQPNTSTDCNDETSRLVCRATGTGFTVEPCDPGLACVLGACVDGAATGAECAMNEDCAGGRCKCGAMTEESCLPIHSPAYCTSACPQGTCGAGEHCLDASVYQWNTLEASYDHCVPSCQADCPRQGFSCRDVPVQGAGGELEWAKGCFYEGLRGLGEACDQDNECVTGTCLRDLFSTGYCSIRCEDKACPDNSACVTLRANEQWCSLRCVDINGTDTCPLDVPTDRFDAQCTTQISKQGTAVKVCTRT